MRLLSIVTVLIFVACGGEQPAADSVGQHPEAQSAPSFEVGLWPGEGIPVIAAARGALTLLQSPSPDAAVAGTLSVGTGSRITYDSTRLRTIVPAVVKATDGAMVRGRFLGALRSLSRDRYYSSAFPDTTISVGTRSRIEYLQRRAEGSCFVRIDGAVLEANPCPVLDSADFAVAGEPELRWWIFARGDSAAGWLLLSDTTAKVVRREF
jgi:hypothetical protein